MIHVLSHIVEIVMLPSRANALLGIYGTFQRGHGKGWVGCSEEERLELIHPSVGEEEGGVVVGDAGTGFPVGVAVLAFEVLDEGGADLVHWPDWVLGEHSFILLVVGVVGHDVADDVKIILSNYLGSVVE